MIKAAVFCGVVLHIVLGGAVFAVGAGRDADFYGATDDDALVVEGILSGGPDATDDAVPAGTNVRYVTVNVPACAANDPAAVPSSWVGCQQMLLFCEVSGHPGLVAYTMFRAVAGPPRGAWAVVRTQCREPGEVPGEVVPEVTLRDLERLPLAAGRVVVEPRSGGVLVRVPMNVYVVASSQEFDTRVLGRAVRVRARPVSYRWSFGDGGELTTADAGAPYPDLRVTHTYVAPGRVRVASSTGYAGEYSVEGGPWTPVTGTAWVDGGAVTREVVAAGAVLVP